jgi:mono/diheme cytochrome c family protein
LNGVVSHVYTYGHRNPQGLDFAPDGTLYSTEHGPKTDDEVNVLRKGGNYGWPHVAGLQDGKTYVYARWAEATTPCRELTFSDLAVHPAVPREPESAFKKKFYPPIATMFTVENGFNFEDPACGGIHYICWPTVGVSSIEHYSNAGGGIPGWDRVLLATTLKRGSLYVWPLRKDGKAVSGHATRYFQSENRFRDTAVSPDGKTIYIATDAQGLVESMDGGVTRTMQDPGAILAFTYVGEGGPGTGPEPAEVTKAAPEEKAPSVFAGRPVHFTAAQAEAGKVAYNASCAVCHGSNLANGTFGTPLAGRYFKEKWFGRSVKALFEHAKTMPPAAPASLPDEKYAEILAYVLELNGLVPGEASTALPTDPEALGELAIR